MRTIADRIRAWPFRRTSRGRHLRGRPEELWLALIAQHAPGRTFVDVGCMWRVNGEYAFAALRTLHAQSYVTRLMAEGFPTLVPLRFAERGWDRHQDVWTYAARE